MLTGHARGDAFVVLDAFALPVVGTETRVNAQSEANEYMVDFLETNKVREKGGGGTTAGGCFFFFFSVSIDCRSTLFSTLPQRAGRAENIVGWYHSHPGYGCWLSGIDVGTQVRMEGGKAKEGGGDQKHFFPHQSPAPLS